MARVGLDQLSDDQVLPLLHAMDADTLLNCGKASERLFKLVCDREIWRHLLKKAEVFNKDMLGELKAFKGTKGGPEMMPEVVIEAARRILFSPLPLTGPIPSPREGGDWNQEKRVRVQVTIEGGWGNSDTFDVDGKHLEELIGVAQEVGVGITLKEVEESPPVVEPVVVPVGLNEDMGDILRVIVAHLQQQQEKLEKLKLFQFVFPLLQFSKRWEIYALALPQDLDDFWPTLANISTSDGHICKLMAPPLTWLPLRAVELNTLRRLWEISDEMTAFHTGTINVQVFSGGRESHLDLDAEWQRILEEIQ